MLILYKCRFWFVHSYRLSAWVCKPNKWKLIVYKKGFSWKPYPHKLSIFDDTFMSHQSNVNQQNNTICFAQHQTVTMGFQQHYTIYNAYRHHNQWEHVQQRKIDEIEQFWIELIAIQNADLFAYFIARMHVCNSSTKNKLRCRINGWFYPYNDNY